MIKFNYFHFQKKKKKLVVKVRNRKGLEQK